MQSVESGECKECGGKKIQTDGHTALKKSPVFHPLPDDENRSEHNRRREPGFHFSVLVCVQSDFGSPNGEAARKQAETEDGCLQHVQVLRAGSALRRRIIKQICENESAEEAQFRDDERHHARFVFLRPKRVDRSSYGYDRVRTIGVHVIPERPSAANWRERIEIFMRWR